MTQHRVENTRVHFWTFSPVSVKSSIYLFLKIHHQGANQGATSEADLVRSGAKFTPIEKIAWCATKSSSDPFIIFSGGTNVDNDTKVCRKYCLWGPRIRNTIFFLIESQGQTDCDDHAGEKRCYSRA